MYSRSVKPRTIDASNVLRMRRVSETEEKQKYIYCFNMKRDIISLVRRIRIIFQACWILLQATYIVLSVCGLSGRIGLDISEKCKKEEKEDINAYHVALKQCFNPLWYYGNTSADCFVI